MGLKSSLGPETVGSVQDTYLNNSVNDLIALIDTLNIADPIITAGEAISVNKVVYSNNGLLFNADSATPTHMSKVVGISSNTVAIGGGSTIKSKGEVIDPLWTWVPGPIYNGPLGVLTQTAPLTGYVLQVATALSSTKIIIDIKAGIIRG